MVNELEYVLEKYKGSNPRHFVKPSERLRASDATVVVCKEWGSGNIDNFIAQAAVLGHTIQIIQQITMTPEAAQEIAKKLIDAGYSEYERVMCKGYTRDSGDSAFIHHSHNIIRCSVDTEGEAIVRGVLGAPNGIASASQDDAYSTWFLNGYEGKAGTRLGEIE